MKAKILLVDDNAAFVDTVKDILEDEGYVVATAQSGEEALSVVKSETFDLILMDIRMPGMNGVESFLKMKTHNAHVRVLLFTAYAFNELIQEARDNGVLAVLKKPLNMPQFLEIIEDAHKGHKSCCILVADDDRDLCDNLHELLTESGYRVRVACDGHEAVQQAEAHVFDILLLDMKLPRLDGLQVYRRVKPLQPQLVTILMTGYAEEMKELIGQALRESAYTLLSKPIDPHQLLQLLDKVTEATVS